MKKSVSVFAALCAVIWLCGCTQINSSDAGSMNLYPETVGPVDAYRPLYKVNETKRVSGVAQVNVLFGIFAWGESSGFADNTSLGDYFSFLPNARKLAASAAFYNACTAAKCDAVVASRYEIKTVNYLFFKKMQVKVSGFPATIVGVETIKPLPYYINGKGEVVVMDKFMIPHRLFDASEKGNKWF